MIADPPSASYALAALAAVLGLIWVAHRLLRGRFGLAPPGAGRVRVADVVALDPRRRVHVIDCEGHVVVVLTGGPQDVVLGWVPPGGGARR